MAKIGILGSGSWGMALALLASRNQHNCLIYTRDTNVRDSINLSSKHPENFSEITLPHTMLASNNLDNFVDCDIILLALPAQITRGILVKLKALHMNQPLVICAKGVEEESLKLQSEIIDEIMPGHKYAVLSGPNFASEIAAGLPAGTTIASKDEDLAIKVSLILNSPSFRCYYSLDVIGAQVCGSVKNIIAIATGIAKGLSLGENAIAAIITRSLVEIDSLNHYKGGSTPTLYGLSGIGDLLLTCKSDKSRNMTLGVELASGFKTEDILKSLGHVAEGYYSAKAVHRICEEQKIEMPICQAVYQILYEKAKISDVIKDLLNRPVRKE